MDWNGLRVDYPEAFDKIEAFISTKHFWIFDDFENAFRDYMGSFIDHIIIIRALHDFFDHYDIKRISNRQNKEKIEFIDSYKILGEKL